MGVARAPRLGRFLFVFNLGGRKEFWPGNG